MSIIDKETGEVFSDSKEGAKAFNTFLNTLEDGEFHAELTNELRDLNADMNNHALNFGCAARGKISINIDIMLKNGVFEVIAKKKITKPEPPRHRSILWSTAGNNFTPHNPKQQDMFKSVNGGKIKNIA